MKIIKTGLPLVVQLVQEIKETERKRRHWSFLSRWKPTDSKKLLPYWHTFTAVICTITETNIHLMEAIDVSDNKLRVLPPSTRVGSISIMTELNLKA